MAKPLNINCYREAVVQGGDIEAVHLDAEGREMSLAASVCKRLSSLHRCDYYKVVGEGMSKNLFLIEKTDLAESVKGAQAKFNSVMEGFITHPEPRVTAQKQENARHPHEVNEFIYRELCEEHAAKAHSTLLVLEKIRLSKLDKDLVGVFCYKKISYVLVITGEYDRMLLGKVLESMEKRFDSTLIGAKYFFAEREDGFETLLSEKIK